jgi:hypothetical protein
MSHTLASNLLQAFTLIVRDSVYTYEALEELSNDKLVSLYRMAESILEVRKEAGLHSPEEPQLTPESVRDALVNRFGPLGGKQLGQVLHGHMEPMVAPDLEKAIVEPELVFPLVRNEMDNWVIQLQDPTIAMNALMMVTTHLQAQGITDGYRLGDLYYFYVVNPDDRGSNIGFCNRTTGKTYIIASTLAQFNTWVQQSVELVAARLKQFHG